MNRTIGRKMTETRAWYLGVTGDQVGDAAVLVGDRGRLTIAADLLDDVRWINEDRGLLTLTGRLGEASITAVAFGMGAPIATVVLHELAQLGVDTFLRLGTMMNLPPVSMGEFILASEAQRHEGTSVAYRSDSGPAQSDASLDRVVLEAAADAGLSIRHGLVASFDGFYPQMAGDPARGFDVGPLRDRLLADGVLGTDMETSALLVAGRALGVRVSSLCAATVDGVSLARLGADEREPLERDLMRVGLDALVRAADRPAVTAVPSARTL